MSYITGSDPCMKQATCPTVMAPDLTGQELWPQILQIQQEHQSFKAFLILHLSHSVAAATLVMPAHTSVKFTSV